MQPIRLKRNSSAKLAELILSDPVNKWVFSSKDAVFLVGGYIRDLFRGIPSKDRDYVVKGNIKKIASRFAEQFQGTVIMFKKDPICRVILQDRNIIDFTPLMGSINENLRHRDFTINALAWSKKSGLIDLHGGVEDIKNRIIRAVRIKNLLLDPLRILRAYRFGLELGGSIEERTKKALKRYSRQLKKVAPERITEELFKILNHDRSTQYLPYLIEDNVLNTILSLKNSKNSNRLARNIKFLKTFDSFLKVTSPDVKKQLEEKTSQGITKKGFLRLVLLAGDNDLRFYEKLRLSRNNKKAFKNVLTAYKLMAGRVTEEKLFEAFMKSQDKAIELSVMICIKKSESPAKIFKYMNSYLRAVNKPLLNGEDIKTILKIKAGPKIGVVLRAAQKAQFKGLINTRMQAKKWLVLNFT
ncbi:MAG TPA: hypothetical protein DEP99_04410 [Nitrospiraceae bacterium]|nr:hypothetical protein [Nitrospiraceae bacterium]